VSGTVRGGHTAHRASGKTWALGQELAPPSLEAAKGSRSFLDE
jgi:hypothetical protein